MALENSPLQSDAREQLSRYLPLDSRRATRFMKDWESLVWGVLQRQRVPDPGDAMSRVFQRALRALPNFRGDSRISTWLYQIAWREGLRQLEKEKRRTGQEVPLEIAVQKPDSADDQLKTLERRETAQTVRAALQKLSVRDREVLALYYLQELPFAQVGQRLNISESAAKVRNHRALSRLRLVLEGKNV